MKNFFVILLCMIGSQVVAQNYSAENTKVGFVIKNAGLPVNGSFDSAAVDLNLKGRKYEKMEIAGKVWVQSIRTGIGLRDKHLRNADYFDAEKYPLITMNSNSFEEQADGSYIGFFTLTLKNVSKDIEVPISIHSDKDKLLISGSFTINRRDFDIGSGSLILADDVEVQVDVRFMM